MGLGNWLLPEGYMWGFVEPGPQSPREIEALVSQLVGPAKAALFWREFRDRFISEDDIARIAAEGMNHVRLPINWRVVMDQTGVLRPEGTALVDRLIEWCRAHGLWVVLDLHGAPGGQTGTNIDDSPNPAPELFTGARWRDLTVSLWQQLADRYRDDTVVAGYDLLNEPLPNEYGDLFRNELVKLYRELSVAIREVDPNHMVIYEGARWATDWSMFSEVWDDNSMLEFHKYWSPPDRPSIQGFIDTGKSLGLPIYMGEGGENNLDWVQTAFQLYDDCEISWCFWTWKKVGVRTSPCSVAPPVGWDEVLAYAAAKAERPASERAWRVLRELANATSLSQCTYQPEVVRALLRRPPVRIPATGFGFRGPGISYQTTTAVALRDFRSDDLVTVHHSNGAEPLNLDFHHSPATPRSAQDELFVSLGPGDWVGYEVEICQPVRLEVVVHMGVGQRSAAGAGSALLVVVDGVRAETVATGDKNVVRASTASPVVAGWHTVRVVGQAREVLLHWLEVMPAR